MKDKNELVSVIMPAYNAEGTIEKSIISVLNQLYSNTELIIVDDASTDQTETIVRHYLNEPRVKYIRLKTNAGIAEARNVAIKASDGRYIAFLDSDDTWNKTKLTLQVRQMQRLNVSASFSAYIRLKSNGQVTAKEKVDAKRDAYGFKELLGGNPIGMLTVMLDSKRIPKEAIVFPQVSHEDYALWLTLARDRDVIFNNYSHDPQANYLVHGSHTSNKFKSAYWTFKIYKGYLNLGLVKSLFCFTRYLATQISKRI
ncbi:glycosyltransferase family 2 protein [Furfurilactobacillus entadae]|uniref:glycosyltransferase family 2 protein n=1 Tax=Furfurilactobacillus entadae TaxID=2922307 RepID=UPI0035E63BA7